MMPAVIIWLAKVIGWVANIIQVATLVSAPITGMFVFKCVGILLGPLGSILGYIGMF